MMRKLSEIKKIAVTAVAALSILLSACGGIDGRGDARRPDAAARPVTVDTVSPVIGNIHVTGEFIGTVEAGRRVTVNPRVAGEVLTANFGVGDFVEAGDILFTIDSTTLQSNIEQAQASLANAQARAQLALDTARQNQANFAAGVEDGKPQNVIAAETALATAELALATADINVSAAFSALSAARRILDDARSLPEGDARDAAIRAARDGAGGVRQREAELDRAEIMLNREQIALEQARINLENALKIAAETAVANANAITQAEIGTNLRDQQIALGRLQNDLENFTIRAPISGVIEAKNIEPRDMAAMQTAAYVIANRDAMRVSFSVAESALVFLSAGDEIVIEKSGGAAAAHITEISSSVNASGLFTIRAEAKDAPFELFAGSAVKVLARTRRAENVIIIPINAVYYERGEPFVYRYEGGLALKTYVETGISDARDIEIISGLTVNDRVISTWSARLGDGVAVGLLGGWS